MHEVKVAYTVQISHNDFMERLSPTSIVEFTEIYDIISIEDEDATKITVLFQGDEMTLEFLELNNGYEYSIVESDGLFEERYSEIRITHDVDTHVTAVARYTFHSKWSFIHDRLAAGTVKKELETLLRNLIHDIQPESATE